MRSVRAIALVLLVCGWVAARIDGASQPSIGVPGRANDNVSLAAAADLVAAVWASPLAEGGSDIYTAVSGNGGVAFSPPVRVNAQPGDARTNGEQPPRVAIVERGGRRAIVVVWTAPGKDGTRILSAESSDGGRTFGTATTVAEASGNRGWHSLTIDPRGRVWVMWLDHRNTATTSARAPKAPHDHQHQAPADAAAAVARAQLSQLMIASPGTSGRAASLAAGVCYCCKTALTSDGAGALYAAWRHVYPGNHRDIAFTLSRDGGKTFAPPVRVSDDHWEINGCPENGPAIAVDRRGWVHVVWATLVGDAGSQRLTLFRALSRDGKTFSKRQRIPTSGDAYHPQVAVDATGSLLVAWDESEGAGRHVSLARGEIDATGVGRFNTIGAPRRGSFPSLAVTSGGAVLAWTNRAGTVPFIEVERLKE
jgi:hypothetical protein